MVAVAEVGDGGGGGWWRWRGSGMSMDVNMRKYASVDMCICRHVCASVDMMYIMCI